MESNTSERQDSAGEWVQCHPRGRRRHFSTTPTKQMTSATPGGAPPMPLTTLRTKTVMDHPSTHRTKELPGIPLSSPPGVSHAGRDVDRGCCHRSSSHGSTERSSSSGSEQSRRGSRRRRRGRHTGEMRTDSPPSTSSVRSSVRSKPRLPSQPPAPSSPTIFLLAPPTPSRLPPFPTPTQKSPPDSESLQRGARGPRQPRRPSSLGPGLMRPGPAVVSPGGQ